MAMHEVMLVDDHPVVRAGLQALVDGFADFRVTLQAGSAEEAVRELALAGTSAPEVILMDVNLGEGAGTTKSMSGIDLTRQLVRDRNRIPVVILSAFEAESDVLAALDAGASGYLLKDASPEQIREALVAVVAGGSAFSGRISQQMAARLRNPAAALSARESEILAEVAAGESNRAIAQKLFISESTVKTHLVHIFSKLDVDSRSGAVAEARARRLIR